MNLVWNQFLVPISPILAIVVASVLLVILAGFPGANRVLSSSIARLGILASLVFTYHLLTHPTAGNLATSEFPLWLVSFKQSYLLDPISIGAFVSINLFAFLTLLFLPSTFPDADRRSEAEVLILFVVSGMMLLASAGNLLVLFVAIELLSLPTYVLVGLKRESRESCEAALKYFLFGSLASVFLVLGITLIFSQFGTLNLAILSSRVAAGAASENPALLFGGMTLLLVSAAFKVGLVPFHMWVPDAYQGAPGAITGFMGSAVKFAGFALLIRLLWEVFLPLAGYWIPTLSGLAVLSMLVGNIAAVLQNNLKRLFAYSSIAHAGYLAVGVLAVSQESPNLEPLYYYLTVYGILFLGIFGILSQLEKETGSCEIYELSGLGFQSPWLGGALALLVLAAAGIPPTAGFLAKYFLFLEAVRTGHTWIVIVAVVSSIIGVYYYLRVLVYLYMKESKRELSLLTGQPIVAIGIFVCAGFMLYLAIAPHGGRKAIRQGYPTENMSLQPPPPMQKGKVPPKQTQ